VVDMQIADTTSGFLVEVTRDEHDEIVRLARRIAASNLRTDPERYAMGAKVLSYNMPRRLIHRIAEFRRYGHPAGGLLIARLPTGDVPLTPEYAETAVDLVPTGAAVLSLVAAILGDQFGFGPELSGLIVQAILPLPGAEWTQRSVSSREALFRHVETAFTRYRADFVLLSCLRADHDGMAGTTIAPIDAILPMLRTDTIEVLRERRFVTKVDESFLIGSGLTGPISIPDVRVLTGPRPRPRLRVDFAETTGTDDRAQAALDELLEVAARVEVTVRLRPGDIVVIDNQHALHGRTAFTPRWDGLDRWLLRTFVARDLAASEDVRPGDGRIIDTDFSSDTRLDNTA
jgi:L-asparagine oxygenase